MKKEVNRIIDSTNDRVKSVKLKENNWKIKHNGLKNIEKYNKKCD